MTQHLTSDTFSEYISSGLVLIDCYARWCPPCQRFMLILPRLEESIGDIAKIGKLDIEESETLATRLEVESIPTFIVYRDGLEKTRWTGIKPIAEIESILRTL